MLQSLNVFLTKFLDQYFEICRNEEAYSAHKRCARRQIVTLRKIKKQIDLQITTINQQLEIIKSYCTCVCTCRWNEFRKE